MKDNAKAFGMALGIFAHFGIFLTTCLPYWQITQKQSSDGVFRTIGVWEGIWWRCLSKREGEFFCDNYKKPTFLVSKDLIFMRTLMCIACMTSYFGVLLLIFSFKCVRAVKDERKRKDWLAFWSGFLFLLGGICDGLGVSWYAAKSIYEFRSPFYTNRQMRYELGPVIYLGWLSCLVILVGGFVMVCGARKTLCGSDNDDPYDTRTSKYPVIPDNRVYI